VVELGKDNYPTAPWKGWDGMPRPDNIEKVNEIKEKLAAAEAVVLTDYQGLNVAEINELRRRFRDANVEYKVYKNTLMSIAVNALNIEGLEEYLEGPTAVAMSQDAKAPVTVINNFVKEFGKPTIKSGLSGTKVFDADGVQDFLKLPSKEKLAAETIGKLKSPLASLVGTLHGMSPVVPLLNVLNQISPEQPLVNVLRNNLDRLFNVLQAITPQNKLLSVLQAVATQKEQEAEEG